MKVAFEGCGHGTLHDIYASVEESAKQKGWDGVDLVVIGGDFQAVRNAHDLNCMAVPAKYRSIGDFQEYYSGSRIAPYLTLFVGGNHEASNHLFELHYGGWVAPNIYYLGASGVIRCGPIRIAGLSGIYKADDYRKPHFERLPYLRNNVRSIYHVRELEVRKLLQIRSQVDVGLSHDWPNLAVYSGDYHALIQNKSHFREDIEKGELGSPAAQLVLEHLRPSLWFSAHLHCKYLGTIDHENPVQLPDAATMPWPVSEPAAESKEVVTADQEKISAWQQFYKVAAEQETEQNQRFLDEQAEHNKRVEAGEVTNVSGTTYNLTWKKVGVGGDGLDRQVTDVVKPNEQANDAPENEDASGRTVKNADEIELDIDSSSETSVRETTGNVNKGASTPQDNSVPASDSKTDQPVFKTESEGQGLRPVGASAPAAEADFKPGGNQTSTQQGFDSPSTITNKVTNFLALDKCRKGSHFLQLLDLPVVSNPDSGDDEKRPYELRYDKEWLAITRALADELTVGHPSPPVPARKGDTHYKNEIRAAEQWVEENIVKQGKMTVPYNFYRTAPIYDRSVSVWTTDQPPEYPNPQTEDFCNLLGIQNKFKMSDEQKQAQDEAVAAHNVEEAQKAQERKQHGHRHGHGRGGRGYRRSRGFGRGRH